MVVKTALLSVWEKTGIVELAAVLAELGIRILSTGGTAEVLTQAGIEVVSVAEYTGFPEILGGRVKTLHPRIHAGILARHHLEEDRRELEKREIWPIGLVVVNLYPFQETIRKADCSLEEAVEQIDIGGPTLLRAAAKNFRHVAVVVDPRDYSQVAAELKMQELAISEKTRRWLAGKAFHQTAAYDAAIAAYLDARGEGEEEVLPPAWDISLKRVASLRYGENPHQRGALYRPRFSPAGGLVAARQHHGKHLSFNNYVDLDAAWRLSREFEEPFCAVIKHTNPCGAATGSGVLEAAQRAFECDPVSAFGSVVAFNRTIDLPTAQWLGERFLEVVLAPGYQEEALEHLRRKKNIRLMELGEEGAPTPGFDVKTVWGGVLIQDSDVIMLDRAKLETVTRREPTAAELEDMLFAWKVSKHVRSNAIVVVRGGQTLGIGAGQMSRVDAVRIAIQKARLDLRGAALASDAFFPFRDGVDEAARAGIRALIQPGGSVRDGEVIEACDEQDLAMSFTSIRHFRH